MVDTWLNNVPLRLVYPNLFRLEKNKWASVSKRVQVSNGFKSLLWDWRRLPSTAEEIAELFNLMSEIYDFEWKGGSDSWRWSADSNGEFSVNSVKNLMQQRWEPGQNSKRLWKGWVPLKCKIMVWRATLNRLPTKMELGKRGVTLPNVLCCWCDSVEETASHLFSGCSFAAEIWSRVDSWCRLPPSFTFDVTDFLEIAKLYPGSKKSKYVLRGIIFTTLWTIWNERNMRIFKGVRRRPIEVMESIKMTSFFWFRNRSKLKSVEWKVWCKFPLDVM